MSHTSHLSHGSVKLWLTSRVRRRKWRACTPLKRICMLYPVAQFFTPIAYDISRTIFTITDDSCFHVTRVASVARSSDNLYQNRTGNLSAGDSCLSTPVIIVAGIGRGDRLSPI